MIEAVTIASAAQMEALGGAVARGGRRGQLVYLHGPLAAGKTTLARGYLRALGHTGAVKSPTFTLVESYVLERAHVHHFDLYRLAAPGELEFVGLEDYLEAGADVLVEWPERGAPLLPPAALAIRIALAGRSRRVTLEGRGEPAKALVSQVLTSFKSIK